MERQDGVAMETSFANGGVLHTSEAEPWSRPACRPTSGAGWARRTRPCCCAAAAGCGAGGSRSSAIARWSDIAAAPRPIYMALLLHPEVHQGDPRGDRGRLRPHAEKERSRSIRARRRSSRAGSSARRYGRTAWCSGRGRQALRDARPALARSNATLGRTVLSARRARRLPQVHDRPAPALRAEAGRALPLRHRGQGAAQDRRPDRCGRDQQRAHERRSLCRSDGQLHAPASAPARHRSRHLSRQGRHGDRARRPLGGQTRKCRSSTTRGCSA